MTTTVRGNGRLAATSRSRPSAWSREPASSKQVAAASRTKINGSVMHSRNGLASWHPLAASAGFIISDVAVITRKRAAAPGGLSATDRAVQRQAEGADNDDRGDPPRRHCRRRQRGGGGQGGDDAGSDAPI